MAPFAANGYDLLDADVVFSAITSILRRFVLDNRRSRLIDAYYPPVRVRWMDSPTVRKQNFPTITDILQIPLQRGWS